MLFGIAKFWIAGRKLNTNIELNYYVKLKAHFDFNKFENLQFDLTGKV